MGRLTLWALIAFVTDQASKYGVLKGLDLEHLRSIDVWPPFLNFRLAYNRGVNFGLFSNDAEMMRWILTGIALAISVWIIAWVWRSRPRVLVQVSAGLLVGGALGNALDRVLQGAVIDFLNMSCCGVNNPYAFNLADVWIFIGAFGLIMFTSPNKTP